MSVRKRRLYRAVITEAPDGPVPRWVYDRWLSPHAPAQLSVLRSRELSGVGAGRVEIDPYDVDDDSEYLASFTAGQSRTYHTAAVAERRARLWRAHGCKVRIDVSEPIVWAEGEAS